MEENNKLAIQAEFAESDPGDIGADWHGTPGAESGGTGAPAAAGAENSFEPDDHMPGSTAEDGASEDGEDSAWPEDASSLPEDEEDCDLEEKREADQSFTLKHLGEVRTVGRDEVIALAQKGLDYDRQRQKNDELTSKNSALLSDAASHAETLALLKELAAPHGMTVEQLIDATRAELLSRDEGIPATAAADRIRTLRAAGLAPGTRPKTPEEAAAEKRHTDIREFLTEYSDIDPKAIPKEVWRAVSDGRTLLAAYQSWELRKLRSESKTAAKNSENREKTTGSRQSAGNRPQRDPITADWYS